MPHLKIHDILQIQNSLYSVGQKEPCLLYCLCMSPIKSLISATVILSSEKQLEQMQRACKIFVVLKHYYSVTAL